MATTQKSIVLVVDDEPDLIENICERLEAEGFQTFSAGSGEKALELFKKEEIDFIVSDVRMAQGDGMWLMSQILALRKPIRSFVIMTAFSDYTRAELLVKGADEVFQKPFKPEALANYLKGILKSSSMKKE
jgi:DNA-binding response OmpR family regulator